MKNASTKEQACGCGPDSCEIGCGGEPIACSLDGRGQAARAAEFRSAFADLLRTEMLADGFRWVFAAKAGLEATLRDLAAREHDCCRFFDFRVFPQEGTIVWEAKASPAGRAVLDELMRLPETLAEERDPQALGRALGERGGLLFAPESGPAAGRG